jgi:hypothetical protein
MEGKGVEARGRGWKKKSKTVDFKSNNWLMGRKKRLLILS